jgi:hypothetical protein
MRAFAPGTISAADRFVASDSAYPEAEKKCAH